MDKFSFLGNTSIDWIEDQYEKYRKDSESIGRDWAHFFEGFEFARKTYDTDTEIPENVQKEFKVLNLIQGYRSRGHLFTRTNPVRDRRQYKPTLDIENFGLTESDLEIVFQAGEELGIGPASLKEIVAHLKKVYCESIGIEFAYIRHPERRKWIIDKVELDNLPKFDVREKRIIFNMINRANSFEQFLQRKFVGQKRFSLEGGESLIPAMHALIQRCTEFGVKEMVIGMAHRGRLNVLGNIFKKDFKNIFSEFEGKDYEYEVNGENFDGDVKYHLGYSKGVKAESGLPIHLTLSPNPSHLEAVNPVVQGMARGKIDNYLNDEKAVLPVLIHGDAAIAAQGVVYEVVQMAQLDANKTGGTIHIVVNNQVGFTTNYRDGRSSTYCTDVAKTTLCPVFHVNGDDAEAVVQTMLVAFQYRQEFGRDVFIDLLCYRKYGHNEGDEPKFTQPKLYDLIAKHPNPREIYAAQLAKENILTQEQDEKLRADFEAELDLALEASKKVAKASVTQFLGNTWKDLRMAEPGEMETSPDTGFDLKKLRELAIRMNTLPGDKKFFRKIVKLMDDRLKMIESDHLDWALGELLAYATLLDEGHDVRLSGQDVERGTFS